MTMKNFEQLFRLQPALLAIQDFATGEFLQLGKSFAQITGHTASEVLGQTDQQLDWWISPVERSARRHELTAQNQALATPGSQHSEIASQCDLFLFTEADRQLLLSTYRPAASDDAASKAERRSALRASEMKFNAIFQSSPIALSVSRVDQNHSLIDVNEAWSRQFNLPRPAITGYGNSDARFWGEAEDSATLFAALEQFGEIRRYEAWRRRADGEFMLCEISARLFEVGGERLLLMAEEDITERRLIELQIRELNATLENRVQERTTELQNAIAQLTTTLEHLQQAQSELLRSEKLAALGSLVAGVAHELNTPIGNALMVASTLNWQTGEFAQSATHELRRSQLLNFIEQSTKASEMIMNSLQRAAELINSFKQVAVDQTSSLRRPFKLKEFVEEILVMLQPQLKKTPYRITHEIPETISLDSFPGPLGQVLNNLIGNAIFHGFDERDHGTISIKAHQIDATHLTLEICDDGLGIPAANLQRIYDPFFTTKLGRGGSGLGLNIVHSIVTNTLGGQIAVRSEIDHGTCFTLNLPNHAPQKEGNGGTQDEATKY